MKPNLSPKRRFLTPEERAEKKRTTRPTSSETSLALASMIADLGVLGDVETERWISHERDGDWVDIFIPKFRCIIEVDGYHHILHYKNDSAKIARLWRAKYAVLSVHIKDVDAARESIESQQELMNKIKRFCYDSRKLLK